jgi:Skp family chaperone for outer membrane proteins
MLGGKPQIAEVRPQTGRNRSPFVARIDKGRKRTWGGRCSVPRARKKINEETAALKARKEGESASKEQRRAEQEANVEHKRKGARDEREAKRNRQEERGKATEALRRGRKVPDGNSSASGEEPSAAEENVDE